MILSEAINLLEDIIQDDYKTLRYDEKYGLSEEGRDAARRIEAWELLTKIAQSVSIREEELKAQYQENYVLQSAVKGYEDALASYRAALEKCFGGEMLKELYSLRSKAAQRG